MYIIDPVTGKARKLVTIGTSNEAPQSLHKPLSWSYITPLANQRKFGTTPSVSYRG
jgi:hypothetical protein